MQTFSQQINALDWFVFLVYLGLVYGFGLYMSRKEETATDFFLAGRRLPWYAVALSLFATNISSGSLVGLAGDGYRVGFAVSTLEWGALLTLSLLAFVYLPYYQRRSVTTMPEFLELRYNLATRLLFGGIVLLFDLLIVMPFVLYTGALVLQVMFGVPLFWGVVGIAVLTGIYTTWGGLAAVVWTDVVQAFFIVAGGVIVTFFGLKEIGGFGALMAQAPDKLHVVLPASHPEYPFPATMIGGYFLISVYYWCHNQTIVQRALGARTEWDARMGTIATCFIKLFLPFILVLPGIIAFVLFPKLDAADKALPVLVREVVPAGFSGLIVSSVIAALMSTASSTINSWGTILTNDFYHRLIDRKAGSRRLILIGRLASVFFLAVCVLRTLLLRETGSILQFLLNGLAYISCPVIVIFASGVFWRRATPAAALTTFFTAPAICYAAQNMRAIFGWGPSQTTAVYWLPIAVGVTAVVMVLVSLVTRPKESSALEGLLWSRADTLNFERGLFQRRDVDGTDGAAPLSERISFWKDHRVMGVVALLIMVLLIWWFR